ncbi:MAG: aminomethyltransferase beta-barrel domain-containing protein, partial [Candidatus Limnocylindrales bacterium]
VDADGALVGAHQGAAAYTVGQRQGLGVALGEPRYVTRIDAGRNLVQIGRREELERRSFEVDDVVYTAGRAPSGESLACQVRIRHRAEPVPGRLSRAGGGGTGQHGAWRVELDRPVWAPAPGQAAVFYGGDEVLGGGRIARPAP